MKRLIVCIAAITCAMWPGFAPGALTSGQKMAAEALLKQFNAPDFDTRQKAVDRLVELGPDVAPVVKKALADTVDNEVKLRCEMVLKQLRDKFGAAAVDGAKDAPAVAPGPPQPVAGDFPPSRVTISVKDAELADILAKFAAESGNTLVHVPDKWDGETVTFDVKDMPYWQALDELCSTIHHCYYNYDYSRTTGACNGMGLWKRASGTEIGDIAGPVAVKLTYGTRGRFLRGQKDAAFGMMGNQGIPPSGDVLTYSLSYYWEDRLPVLARDARITKMTGSDGKELKLLQRFQGLGEFARDPGIKPFFATFDVVALDVPDGIEKIAEIDGIITLTYGHGERTIKIDDVLNATGKSVTDGDTTITVVKLNNQPGSLSLVVKLKKGDKEVQVPVYAYNAEYGFMLVGADGTKHRGMMSRGGGMDVVAGGGTFAVGPGSTTTIPNAAQAGPGERAVAFFTGRQGGLRGANNVNEKIDGLWTLFYTRPAECWSKEYPFTLKDVPLP